MKPSEQNGGSAPRERTDNRSAASSHHANTDLKHKRLSDALRQNLARRKAAKC